MADMHTTARTEYDSVDTFHKSDGIGFCLLENNACARHKIEPVLQLCRNVEIAHRCTDEFIDQCVREGDSVAA